MEHLHYLSVVDAAYKLRSKELSPVELTQAHLSRIQQLDGQLNSYITILGDRALEQARAAEVDFLSGRVRSPLQGIPFAVKDLIYTSGIRTTAGSKILWGFFPRYDATVMTRLENNGAVLLGKLNMMEFAMGGTYTNVHYGPARNPWDIDRFAGASSNGSACAVAAGLSMVSLGTDTGGSIRGPAHNCGIVGLKPTYGRVSRYGIVPLSWSLDHVGPMTRTVEDCAVVLQSIAGHDPLDPTSSKAPVSDYVGQLRNGIHGLRVGLLPSLFSNQLQEDVSKGIDSAIDVLSRLGAVVKKLDSEPSPKIHTLYEHIAYPEATAYHLSWMRTRIDEYGPNCRARLEQGLVIPAIHYIEAQQDRSRLLEAYLNAFKKVDVIVAPISPNTAPRLDEEFLDVIADPHTHRQYTSPMNLTGLPALALPVGFGPGGLPITFQVVGRPFEEETILRVGYAYQQVTPWHTMHPEVVALNLDG